MSKKKNKTKKKKKEEKPKVDTKKTKAILEEIIVPTLEVLEQEKAHIIL